MNQDENSQESSKMQPFEVQEGSSPRNNKDPAPSNLSVLGGRKSPKNSDGKNNQNLQYSNLREKTADKLISAGKSIWGYFSAAADQVRGKDKME